MNITDFKVDGWASIDANDIPIDTVFSGRMGLCWAISSVFLKGYDVIVDLNSPRNTWVAFSGTNIVKDYRPLNVKLVINGPSGIVT